MKPWQSGFPCHPKRTGGHRWSLYERGTEGTYLGYRGFHMSHLYRHLRIHQVFGANTDVGKTIVTTALVRASALKNNAVFYLKPISTGPLHDADDKHIKRFAGPNQSLVETQCLFRYDEPVSPHLAVKMASGASENAVRMLAVLMIVFTTQLP